MHLRILQGEGLKNREIGRNHAHRPYTGWARPPVHPSKMVENYFIGKRKNMNYKCATF